MKVPAPTEKLDLPDPVARDLDSLLQAARSGKAVDAAVFDRVLEFSAKTAMGTGNRILPERPEGLGVFYYCPLPFSLADVLHYTMDPQVPGAAVFPTSVRRGAWKSGADALKGFTVPATEVRQAHAREYEQITPDETTGSYYAYTLNRLFAVAPVHIERNGKTALFQVSIQDGRSENGLKGAILGPDADWNYVYTGVQGSTLPMVGWAETYIYGAATVNIWVEPENGKAYLYSYKWLKAGWSGMNMVKTSHISAGVTRYLDGLSQVLGSARRPSPAELATAAARYAAMSDDEQITALGAFSRDLEKLATASGLTGGDFTKVLKNGAYARSLSREDREAELVKLFVKQKLGLPFSSASR